MINKIKKFFGSVNPSDSGAPAYILPDSAPFAGVSFDGEQEPGGFEDLFYIYDVDYYTLARRAYTLVTINEFARLAISRLTQFAVGTGLKLHPEPCRRFLKRKFGINLPEDFAKDIQELYELFANDKNVSITKEDNLHSLANQVFFNSFVAGDVLVIKRVKNKNLEYQLVNGLSVKSSNSTTSDGKKIKSGVELDENGKHLAYYIQTSEGKEERIPAYDSKGRAIAWLVYASDKRLNSVRGYSPLGAIMQKLRKTGQYANAEVIAAESNARFAAVIEHDKDSSGVNPLKGFKGAVRGLQNDIKITPSDSAAVSAEISDFRRNLKKIASGLFFNVPKGQKMSSFDTKRPNVNYTAFLDGTMKYAYAAMGIPFEIAILLFSNNFSASRAALKMFELIIEYLQKYNIIDRFYQITYEQFFELECLKGNIYAPQYLNLKNDSGYMDNAYTKAKFIGKKIPHIDEVKEVNAVISKLKAGLITYEQALETLGNTVDFDTLVERLSYENKKFNESGITIETLFAPEPGDNENKENKKEVENE